MTDYYPLLSRAVADRSEAEREAIYVRARGALERQLRSFEPALPEADIARELDALGAVIERIESEQPDLGPPNPPAVPEPAPETISAPEIREASASAPDTIPNSQPPVQAVLRPRVPMRSDSRGTRKKAALFGGIALALMIAVGVVAISRRDDPNRFATQKAPPLVAAPSSPTGEDAKTEGRLGGGGNPSPTETPPAKTQDARPAQPEPPARPPQSVQQPATSTHGRAFMVVEAPGGAAPNQYEGRADWTFAADAALKGQRSLRTKVEFPHAGLAVELSIARNTDPAINASHTLMVIFEPGNGVDPVREMSAIEWREAENQTGSMLAGVVVPVADNVFMFGLDKADAAAARNLDLLRGQRWMVFEFRLANGRRGAILAEKGVSGEKAAADAVTAWK